MRTEMINTAEFKQIFKIAKMHMNSHYPAAFKNVAFVLRDKKLKIQTTNTDTAFQSNAITTLDAPDTTWLCPVQQLNEFVKRHKEQDVSFRVEGDRLMVGDMWVLKDVGDWPMLFTTINMNNAHTLDQEMFRKLAPAMSDDKTRSNLCGVTLNGERSEGAATDGHRMHVVNIIYSGLTVTIPSKIVRAMLECEQIAMAGQFYDKVMWINTEYGHHCFREAHSNPTEYYRFIPKEFNSHIENNTADLLNKLEAIEPFTNKKSRGVRFQEGTVESILKADDVFTAKKEVIQHQKGAKLFCNIEYLIDALKQMDSSTVHLKYFSEENGSVMKPTLITSNGFTAVIMPMRGE